MDRFPDGINFSVKSLLYVCMYVGGWVGGWGGISKAGRYVGGG